MFDKWISRWKDPSFKKDLEALRAYGVTNPEFGWFLLPIIKELDRTVMVTYTGRRVSLINPDPADLCLEDICHHLALENRFNGATMQPYSTAQHSLWCWEVFMEMTRGQASEAEQFTMVMHDGPEAYLKDLPRPLKRILRPIYSFLDRRFWDAMRTRWPRLLPGKTELMERVDKMSAATEQRDLFLHPRQWGADPSKVKHDTTLVVIPWDQAEQRMLTLARNLQG